MKWLALKIAQELVHIYRGATMVYLWAVQPDEEHKARMRAHVQRLQDRIDSAKG